ncbi:MAG: methionine--tRNA ligase [bacterium]
MKPIINFEDYVKVDVRVGKIVAAEIPIGSEALIKFTVDFGAEEGQKTILSGIKKWYVPEELIGKQTTWVLNLAPKKTPFGDSEGMLFAVDQEDGKPLIVEIPENVKPGVAFH